VCLAGGKPLLKGALLKMLIPPQGGGNILAAPGGKDPGGLWGAPLRPFYA